MEISTNLMKRSTDEDCAAGHVGVRAIRGDAFLIFYVIYSFTRPAWLWLSQLT